MNKKFSDETIVAISTPIGEGGIGIVRMSGPEALNIADAVFVSRDKHKPSRFKTYTTHYGHIVDRPGTKKKKAAAAGEIIDEVLLTVMKAPKSYTKEDIVEINCHGGIQAAKRVLELVLRTTQARLAEPGEFTKRAFLNGRIDLAQAEAVLDVIRSKTEGSLKVAMASLKGELSERVNTIREKAVEIASHIDAGIDFPDEDVDIMEEAQVAKSVEDILRGLRVLIDTYDGGMVFREGVLAIICGKPNVGKSSLMNLLLKRDRVIVSPIPGTTRDAVEEMINLKGIPIRLVDTAGISEAKDLLEKKSVDRSKAYLGLADIVLLMLDASTDIGKEDFDIVRLTGGKKRIVVFNKTDLGKKIDGKMARSLFKGDVMVEISVEKRKNIELLENAISDSVWGAGFDQGESAIVANARHKELLDKSLDNMISVKTALKAKAPSEVAAVDLKDAIYNLGLITGRSVSDDILDRIFEQFCIGK